MQKASAGGVNKEQARENFHQECEDEQPFSAHNQGQTQTLDITDTKEGEDEPWGSIKLQVMAATRTRWTSLYPETDS